MRKYQYQDKEMYFVRLWVRVTQLCSRCATDSVIRADLDRVTYSWHGVGYVMQIILLSGSYKGKQYGFYYHKQ